jgi:hypothetical protein
VGELFAFLYGDDLRFALDFLIPMLAGGSIDPADGHRGESVVGPITKLQSTPSDCRLDVLDQEDEV